MFPDMVKLEDLQKVKTGDGWLVGEIKTAGANHAPTRTGEIVMKFEGLNTLFDYMKLNMPKPKRDGASNATRGSHRSKFYTFNKYTEAVDVYRNNPASVCEYTQADLYIAGGESSGKELAYDVTGDILDIGRYLNDEPECFGSLTNGNPRNKRVNIVVNNSWWAGVDHEIINQRGRRLLRLVDWLESQQIRTQVIALSSSECEHLEVIVKHFDEPLNLNDVAIIGHSDFLRRVIFRIDEYSDTWRNGYGSCSTLSIYFNNHPEAFASEYSGEYTLLIDTTGTDDYSIDDLNEVFDEFEAKLAIELEGDDLARVIKVL